MYRLWIFQSYLCCNWFYLLQCTFLKTCKSHTLATCFTSYIIPPPLLSLFFFFLILLSIFSQAYYFPPSVSSFLSPSFLLSLFPFHLFSFSFFSILTFWLVNILVLSLLNFLLPGYLVKIALVLCISHTLQLYLRSARTGDWNSSRVQKG